MIHVGRPAARARRANRTASSASSAPDVFVSSNTRSGSMASRMSPSAAVIVHPPQRDRHHLRPRRHDRRCQ